MQDEISHLRGEREEERRKSQVSTLAEVHSSKSSHSRGIEASPKGTGLAMRETQVAKNVELLKSEEDCRSSLHRWLVD